MLRSFAFDDRRALGLGSRSAGVLFTLLGDCLKLGLLSLGLLIRKARS
jgi:hypothetical protein